MFDSLKASGFHFVLFVQFLVSAAANPLIYMSGFISWLLLCVLDLPLFGGGRGGGDQQRWLQGAGREILAWNC